MLFLIAKGMFHVEHSGRVRCSHMANSADRVMHAVLFARRGTMGAGQQLRAIIGESYQIFEDYRVSLWGGVVAVLNPSDVYPRIILSKNSYPPPSIDIL